MTAADQSGRILARLGKGAAEKAKGDGEIGSMRKLLPPSYFLGAIVLAITLHFLLPVQQILAFPWRLLGLAPFVTGLVLNLLADQAFK